MFKIYSLYKYLNDYFNIYSRENSTIYCFNTLNLVSWKQNRILNIWHSYKTRTPVVLKMCFSEAV